MDDKETKNRRLRLKELIDFCFDGRQADLIAHIHNKTGKTPNQGEISALLKTDSGKSFGYKKAGTLATQIGLNRSWFEMDLGTNLKRSSWSLDDLSKNESPSRSFVSNVEPGSNGEVAPNLAPAKLVPVVGTAQLGDNGYWSELEYPVGHGDGCVMAWTSDINAYAIRCRGNSMSPRIKDGEFVVIAPSQVPIPGDEVIIKHADERVMIKQFLYERDGLIHLMSVNEAHPPVAFNRDEIQRFCPVVAILKRGMWAP